MSPDESAAVPMSEDPDYLSGFNAGKQDGWSGGDYSPADTGEQYLRGYNDGWREGRKNPKPRGQLPPSSKE